MKATNLDSWKELPPRVTAIADELKEAGGRENVFVSSLLFRGQSNADWDLLTTLERFGAMGISIADYYQAAYACRHEIEAHTGRAWPAPTPIEYRKLARIYDQITWPEGYGHFPAANYLAYLRHHGFPSPLLDWTLSAYIALFFAYRFPTEAVRAAVYVYCEWPSGHKASSSNDPQIYGIGPYVGTHRRHFLQQCEYTVCWRFTDSEWHYRPHSEVFAAAKEEDQDAIWKFTMPAADRIDVLSYLNSVNLNAYSLFASEDALMETMAMRELQRRMSNFNRS